MLGSDMVGATNHHLTHPPASARLAQAPRPTLLERRLCAELGAAGLARDVHTWGVLSNGHPEGTTAMPPYLHLGILIGTLLGAAVMVGWRMREARSPVTLVKIVAPPLGMTTGFSMFLFPPTRVPLSWGLAAFLLGALIFSYPLLRTSRLIRSGEAIFVQRSKAFLWILLGLVAVRLGLRSYAEQYMGTFQTGALLFLLAYGMVLRWRVGMLREFQHLRARVAQVASQPLDHQVVRA
jgi:membrane protein CcdC involved in cytochrome C biogenesis